MLRRIGWSVALAGVLAALLAGISRLHGYDYVACAAKVLQGLRLVADRREDRFTGKVDDTALACRGDRRAVADADVPWVDWQRYWATGGEESRAQEWLGIVGGLHGYLKNGIGEFGALVDLEYQRMELVKFNLFDNATWPTYIAGRDGLSGPVIRRWPEMRLDRSDAGFIFLRIDEAGNQRCSGPLIRFRTANGICNDIDNPAMGASGQLFARNVQFEETFPDEGRTELTHNRHEGRIGLLRPDPQVISRRLLSRRGPPPESDTCHDGEGLPGFDPRAECPYRKAPFFNVLAAFWIQFMTHDWFSHLDEARNGPAMMATGCTSHKVGGAEQPLLPDAVKPLGCRPDDRIERGLVRDADAPATFVHDGRTYLARAPRTTRNFNTAWWDASQIYGYDRRSALRLRRDPVDRARILMPELPGRTTGGDAQGYLATFEACGADEAASDCLVRPEWVGQEMTGFPDNWSIGLSFLSNVFAREHNLFVAAFRTQAQRTPAEDCGLRNPERPGEPILYSAVTPDELFGVARLVVAAEIAKIHTTEWTPQLLYDRPLDVAMDSNWNGVFGGSPALKHALSRVVDHLGASEQARARTMLYSVFSSGPGIIGSGSTRAGWNIANPDDVNGGVNHFGSPFNFPEEFTAVYRLHALVPDLIEMREARGDHNRIAAKVPVSQTRRAMATRLMHERGLADWALSFGRQRLGLLALENAPRFLQHLPLPHRLDATPTQKIDVVALDILRDRERGIPRFNEFRRQYGLRSLTGFDDFIERRLTAKESAGTLTPAEASELADERRLVGTLREIYGTHTCDDSKVITGAARDVRGTRPRPLTDCLGRRHGDTVDNIEDLDLYVGWHAETTRPHGFAISETQFQVFILNASRRLYSDRFFTSSFRPEFYSTLGLAWVKENGPGKNGNEPQPVNGRLRLVSPLKRLLLRVLPELADELGPVVNTFDPWARDRGRYYSLAWKPRPGAESDPSFRAQD